ncbi:sialidase family protein [Kitasatospora sp. NPDC059795]|uniref:sialidase family protein n=1 Tax=Kitasatospora sp. NPDC059795 TaxID=3346949 RepID=UPI003656D398
MSIRSVFPVAGRPVALLLAGVAVAASVLVAPGHAQAAPVCDQPKPPPICFEPPDPDPDQAAEGSFEVIVGANGGVVVSGWARDPDTDAPAKVRVRRNGTQVAEFTANDYRYDVGNHAYSRTLPAAPAGQQTVCLAAVNMYAGAPHQAAETPLGCRSYTAGLYTVGVDPYTTADTQHSAAVEADSHAWGSTVVSAYQVGRAFDGGSTNIGFAVSRDAGLSWTSDVLPGLTVAGGGTHQRASDPVVAYSARWDTWMVGSLVFDGGGGTGIMVNRSWDAGGHWTTPTWAIGNDGAEWDKEWIACDNWTSSPYYGTCYLTVTKMTGYQVELAKSTDGGRTWMPVDGPRPATNGSYPVVRPDGAVVVLYGLNGRVGSFTVTGGGTGWTGPATVSNGSRYDVPDLRDVSVVSADVDSTGRINAVWHGCRAATGCAWNGIVQATSTDGRNWTVSEIDTCPDTALCAATHRFAPTITADPQTPGRFAIVFNDLWSSGVSVRYLSSTDGGGTWKKRTTPLTDVMPLTRMPDTSQGRMLGEYLGIATANGTVVTTFPVAAAPAGGQAFAQTMSTYTPLGF